MLFCSGYKRMMDGTGRFYTSFSIQKNGLADGRWKIAGNFLGNVWLRVMEYTIEPGLDRREQESDYTLRIFKRDEGREWERDAENSCQTKNRAERMIFSSTAFYPVWRSKSTPESLVRAAAGSVYCVFFRYRIKSPLH